INRRAEVRDHPLVNRILAVVALPVRDARAGYRGPEPVGLRNGPHGHVSAIAPAGNTNALFVDRIFPDHLIDAFEDVAKIAVTEILDVGAGECLTLAVAAPGIRK